MAAACGVTVVVVMRHAVCLLSHLVATATWYTQQLWSRLMPAVLWLRAAVELSAGVQCLQAVMNECVVAVSCGAGACGRTSHSPLSCDERAEGGGCCLLRAHMVNCVCVNLCCTVLVGGKCVCVHVRSHKR